MFFSSVIAPKVAQILCDALKIKHFNGDYQFFGTLYHHLMIENPNRLDISNMFRERLFLFTVSELNIKLTCLHEDLGIKL